MDRPLWQILLPLFLIGLAVHRAAIGSVLYASEVSPALVAAYGLQTAAALVTAVAMWLGRPWTITFLLLLGMMLAASSLLEGFWLQLRPPIASVSEVLVIALSTGALALVLRREFGENGSGHEMI